MLELDTSQLTPKVGSTIFIAVDGHGGSGKSTFAKYLSEFLNAEIIHTDDFAGWDDPIDWFPKIIEQVFEPIKNGATALSYQPASWWENHHPEPVAGQPVTPIMILEGVSSSRKEFEDYLSLRIFVDTPKDICLERGIERDSATGKSKDERTKIWQGLIREEDDFFEKYHPKDKAEILIDGTIPFSSQIKIA